MFTPIFHRASIGLLAALGGILLVPPPSTLHAQNLGPVAGTVLSVENDSPLPGATVTVLEGDLSAVTDQNGHFLLSGLSFGEVTLRIELSGYASIVETVIPVPAEYGALQIRLAPIFATLSELVVNAAGPPRGSSAEVVITNDDHKTALDLLAERIPAIVATGVGLGPVRASTVKIRGNSSLTLGSVPSIYLDGIRLEGAGQNGLETLQEIPASDIAAIRILKGPSATAQYGDAASGVILIETIRGGR
jgi:TonB-dependent SusC/RagA subfamily outer membrane receptor